MKTSEILARYNAERASVNHNNPLSVSLPDESMVKYLKELLSAEDFHHLTAGHPVSPDFYHVYFRNPKMPTGCQHALSFPKTEAFTAVVEAHNTPAYPGGTMGPSYGRN